MVRLLYKRFVIRILTQDIDPRGLGFGFFSFELHKKIRIEFCYVIWYT